MGPESSLPANEEAGHRGGIRCLLHDPARLPADFVTRSWAGRSALLQGLVEDLLDPGADSNHVVVGSRGMGKSFLLRRIALALENAHVDPPLVVLQLAPPPSVSSDVRAIEDSRGNKSVTTELPDFLSSVDAPIVVLVDDLDLWSVHREHPQHPMGRILRARERNPRIRFVATLARFEALGPSAAYWTATLRRHELPGFTPHETSEALQRWMATMPRVFDGRSRDRLERLMLGFRDLTGGNPRLLAMARNLLLLEDGLDLGDLLLGVLDMESPLHRARLDTLPEQAREVLFALAVAWDPEGAAGVAGLTGLGVNTVSAQLGRLQQGSWIRRITSNRPGRARFLVQDRMLALWALARSGATGRERILELARFIEGFTRRERQSTPVARTAEIEILPDWRQAAARHEPGEARLHESRGLDLLLADMLERRARLREYFDLDENSGVSESLAMRQARLAGARENLMNAPLDWKGIGCPAELYWSLLGGSASFSAREKERISSYFEMLPTGMAADLLQALEQEAGCMERLLGVTAWEGLRAALRLGFMEAPHDIEGAMLAERKTGRRNLALLARAFHLVSRGYDARHVAGIEAGVDMCASTFVWALWSDLLLEHLDREEEAERALGRAVQLGPDFLALWLKLAGLVQRFPGREADAEKAWRRALDLDPRRTATLHGLAVLLKRFADRSDEAEALLRRAIEQDPADPWLWMELANLIQDLPERGAEAEAALRKALSIDPIDAWVWCNLGGFLLAHEGRRQEAREALERAVALDPHSCPAWNELGRLLLSEGLQPEAEAAFRSAMSANPSDPRPHLNLGVLHAKEERWDLAAQAWEEARRLDPLDARALENLGRLRALEHHDLSGAERLLRQAADLAPADAGPASALASLLAGDGARRAESVEAWRRCVALEPDSWRAWMGLGDILSSNPETLAEASESWRRALTLAPTETRVLGRLVNAFLERGGDPREAEVLARRLLEAEGPGASASLALARVLARSGALPEAFRRLGDWLSALPALSQWRVDEGVMEILHDAVRLGMAEEAADALAAMGLGRSWRPLLLVLRGLACSNEPFEYEHIAPELQQACREALERLSSRT